MTLQEHLLSKPSRLLFGNGSRVEPHYVLETAECITVTWRCNGAGCACGGGEVTTVYDVLELWPKSILGRVVSGHPSRGWKPLWAVLRWKAAK